MKKLPVSMAICMIATLSTPALASTAAEPLDTNGQNAKAQFKTSYEFRVPSGSSGSTINSYLKDAANDATASAPIMVYVKSGTYKLTSALNVPENVVLVSENAVTYENASSGDNMVNLKGAVYGGTFDGKGKHENIIQMTSTKATASDKNMLVTKATLKNTYFTAVQINGKYLHGKVINNNISNCELNGISVYRAGQYELIQGNTITKIGHKKRPGDKKAGGSGIDICSSNVNAIKNNTIKNVYGHGISTDPTSSGMKLGCKINEISGNTISTIKTQGIYIENKCSATRVQNNKISNVKGCCLVVDKNAKVSLLSGNTFTGGAYAKQGKHSLITTSGKGAYIKFGKNNKVYGGSAAGIALGKKAKVIISGNGNVITKNKLNGIQMDKGSVLKITGKTTITKNRWGINMAKGASANIKNVKFSGNKKGAVYYIKGAKFKKSKCSVKGKIIKAK